MDISHAYHALVTVISDFIVIPYQLLSFDALKLFLIGKNLGIRVLVGHQQFCQRLNLAIVSLLGSQLVELEVPDLKILSYGLIVQLFVKEVSHA